MNITNEPYRFEGYWAFSTDKSYWFSGVLEYSPKEKKIELRMWGAKKSTKLDFQADTLLGRTTDGVKITLLNCIVRSSSRRIDEKKSDENTFLHIIEATKVIIGEHYDKHHDIGFSNIRVRFSDQFYFIQKDGFQHDFSRQIIKVAYIAPDEIVLSDSNNISLKITFHGMPGPSILSLNEFSIVQFEYFDISFPENYDLRNLINEINFLKYIIALSINKNISLIECSLREKNINEEAKNSGICLLDSFFFREKSREFPHQRHQNLIDMDDFSNYPDLYEKWRLVCKEKESAIYKYFKTIYDDGYFLEERFHKIVMAFEDYHRNSPCFPQTISTQNEKNRKIFLRERIDSVFVIFEKPLFYLFKDLGEKNRIIKLIVDTRDYLTHGGDVKKALSIKGPSGYFKLTDLLISIIALMILKDLGFTEDEIKEKIWNLPSYYALVDYDWSDIQ